MDNLKQVILKGFKSIKDMDLELRPLNILIGCKWRGKKQFCLILQNAERNEGKSFANLYRCRWSRPVSVALWVEDDTTSGGDTTV